MEAGMTTPPKMRRVAENDYEIGNKTNKLNTIPHQTHLQRKTCDKNSISFLLTHPLGACTSTQEAQRYLKLFLKQTLMLVDIL